MLGICIHQHTFKCVYAHIVEHVTETIYIWFNGNRENMIKHRRENSSALILVISWDRLEATGSKGVRWEKRESQVKDKKHGVGWNPFLSSGFGKAGRWGEKGLPGPNHCIWRTFKMCGKNFNFHVASSSLFWIEDHFEIDSLCEYFNFYYQCDATHSESFFFDSILREMCRFLVHNHSLCLWLSSAPGAT